MLDRFAQDDFALDGEGQQHQRLRAVARGLLQLREEAERRGIDRDQLRRSVPGGGQRVGEALAPRIVAVDHADVVEAAIADQLRQHRRLADVGERGTEEEVVVVGNGQLRRRAHRDLGNAGGSAHALGDGQGDGAGECADDRVDLLHFHQPSGFLNAQQRFELGVGHDQFNRFAEDAAGIVEMLDRQLDAEPHLGAELRQTAGEVEQQADPERPLVARLCLCLGLCFGLRLALLRLLFRG